MLVVSQLHGFNAVRRKLALTYIGSNSSTTDATTYDFGDFTAATAGLMIVAAARRSSGTGQLLSSVSIGGTNGSVHQDGGTLGSSNAGIASRLVNKGANNVSVTWSASVTSCAVFVWLLTGFKSATPVAGYALSSNTSGTSLPATFDIPANGAAVYVNTHANTNATSWDGATIRDDLTAEVRYSGADLVTAAALAGHVETPSWTGSAGRAVAGASWN